MASDTGSDAENLNVDLVIPSFIKEEFFHEILKKDYPDFQRIITFTPKAATSPGENYLSIMIRVGIHIELKDASRVQVFYVVKTMLEASEATEILEEMHIFPKEKEVYSSILPQFEKLYAEVGQTVNFGPQCKFVEETTERVTIVMEDLKPRKFETIDRRIGFDLPHMKEVLKKLAQFHAASLVLFERNGRYSEYFYHSVFNEKVQEFYKKMGEKKRQLFLEALAKWSGCEKYVDLWPSQEKFIAWTLENENGQPNELVVLNHGDLWSNNIMFNYDDGGDINETYFIDYQLCRWGSPTQDLYYLITNSAGYDIRVKEFDTFIRIYQENLAENLKVLGYKKPIPSLKDVHILTIKYSLWSFFTATGVTPAVLVDPVENANIDEMLNAGEFLKTCLMTPRYVDTMKQLLPWWENRGLFQIDVTMNKPNQTPDNAENPNDSLKIPAFVNEAYFKPILEKDYPDFKSIIKFTPVAATGPGENYTSIMVRAFIEIELKDSTRVQVSYILKTMLEGMESNELLKKMNIFPKEKEVYFSILQQFEKLYADAGKSVRFGPQCKFVEETPERITIVLEDLKPKNFKNIDRLSGFDMAHMEKVLTKMAEFHAASAVHFERFGPYSEQYNESFFNKQNQAVSQVIGSQKRKLLMEVMAQWGDCEKYIGLWPSLEEYYDWFTKNINGAPDELKVLNHGDLWSNNIMFQYNEEGAIYETYFVDFQMCKWGSPTQDLYHMITNSAGYDIRVKEFDRFIRIYQENLAKNLRLLNFSQPIPSLKDVHVLMIKYSLWSLFTATNFTPAILLDPVEDASMDNLLGSGEFQRISMTSPRYVKAMKQLLPWWENRGVFQITP